MTSIPNYLVTLKVQNCNQYLQPICMFIVTDSARLSSIHSKPAVYFTKRKLIPVHECNEVEYFWPESLSGNCLNKFDFCLLTLSGVHTWHIGTCFLPIFSRSDINFWGHKIDNQLWFFRYRFPWLAWVRVPRTHTMEINKGAFHAV